MTPHDQGSHEPSPATVKVLVIEDDPRWASLMARVLSSARDWHPVTVRDLREALEALAGQSWDLVVSDLNLPDSFGLSTLHRLRECSPGTPVVIMSGENEDALVRQALQAGAQDWLVKGTLDSATVLRVTRNACERARLDREIRQSRELLQTTLDALPACIAVLDGDGRVLDVNRNWSHYSDPHNPLIWDCPPGTDYLQVCCQAHELNEDLAEASEGILDVARGLRPLFRIDYRVMEGAKPRWFALDVTRFAQDRRPSGLVVTYMEVTERKELEARLRASESLFTVISENVQDLMAIVDAKGERLYSSSSYSASLGYLPEEMARHDRRDLLHPEDAPRMAEAMTSLLSGGSANLLEYRLRHRDGSYRWFESRGSLIRGDHPGEDRILFVARDITQRKQEEADRAQIEARLRQAQKLEAIGQLAAGIAHEINTPTQYIGDNAIFLRDTLGELCGFFEEISKAVKGPDAEGMARIRNRFRALDFDFVRTEVPKAIQQTIEGVERVTRIVSAMKDFSHPSGASREAIDLNRAINSTTTVSRNEWKYVSEMTLDLAPDLPLVPCYPSELNQVILNLIVNSAHAIAEAREQRGIKGLGRIIIRTRQRGDTVRIEVEDTGTGIPEAIRERIFEPFFTTKPVGRGTGQGLSLAHSVIVEKHGGRLSVESREGEGTTFLIELPLHSETL
nr:PAS domain S-box protein [uncultured Holophaga sp.]